jgi:hypothetical protein
MDLFRDVYGRDLNIAAMRALEAGARTGEIARKHQLSPIYWSVGAVSGAPKGNRPFPGLGGAALYRETLRTADR